MLIPGDPAALIGAHLALLVRQKHTQFPAPGKTEATVSGERIFPVYAAKAGGFFFLVFGVICALGGLAQINPIWLFGPYNPAQVSAGSQPDWYMGLLDGSTRLFPSWDIRLWQLHDSGDLLADGRAADHPAQPWPRYTRSSRRG